MNKKKRTGFTLIELLVVIAIIGILATIVMATFSDVKARSRDSRRAEDINTLHAALAMYQTQFSNYPVANVNPPPATPPGVPLNASDVGLVLKALSDAKILQNQIADPQDGRVVGSDVYHYYYFSADGKSYTITYCMETNSIRGDTAGCTNQVSF